MGDSLGSEVHRQSVALKGSLLREATALAPSELRGNFNRLVTVALEEYVARQREKAFDQEMAEMARDPGIRRVNKEIAEEFAPAELDGLDAGPSAPITQKRSVRKP